MSELEKDTVEHWQPIPKEWHGHDMVQLFTLYLIDEIAGSKISRSSNIVDSYWYEKIKPYAQKRNKMVNNLKKRGHHLYEERSVFAEYKKLRTAWLAYMQQQGISSSDINDTFYIWMSGEEIFKKAHAMVSTWWDVVP